MRKKSTALGQAPRPKSLSPQQHLDGAIPRKERRHKGSASQATKIFSYFLQQDDGPSSAHNGGMMTTTALES